MDLIERKDSERDVPNEVNGADHSHGVEVQGPEILLFLLLLQVTNSVQGM